ncbi:MAG: nucleotidyltransferase family protein, partial [Betaproteobacteria bacterium]|nr:nucleotidyltransferase family protein [Betaproteobacteria bacterium]
MRAMIRAAGRGERMRPLTDSCPKPLLPIGGKPLIVWHLERLAAAGFTEVIVNHAHLGEQIEAALGNGKIWGLDIAYSPEPPGALETAGGIAQALPLLGDEPFLVVNGDIYCDWDFRRARDLSLANDLAHLVLVPNPPQHPAGDFALAGTRVKDEGTPRHTFAGIGVYRPELFAGLTRGQPAKLAPLLRHAMADDQVNGELHQGRWEDVGTPERLGKLDQ